MDDKFLAIKAAQEGRCYLCGSDEVDSNVNEAWCYGCDRQWDKDGDPDTWDAEIYTAIRSFTLVSRAAYPIEPNARREALGLSQVSLADWLPWKQSRVSEAMRGVRPWPEWADRRLTEAEEVCADFTEDLCLKVHQQVEGGLMPAIPSYLNDRAFWTDQPARRGIPASIHRVAAVRAQQALHDQGITARIVDAGLAQDPPED